MWLLVVFSILHATLSMHWSYIPDTARTVNAIFIFNTVFQAVLKENSTYWRDTAAERRKNFLYKDLEQEEGVPLVHLLRLFGCVFIMVQFVFILHLTVSFLRNGNKDIFSCESSSKDMQLKLVIMRTISSNLSICPK